MFNLGRQDAFLAHGRDVVGNVDALDPDLIVMGKHGQSEWEELLLGSVTKHVLREASCDVLVVSPDRLKEA